MKTALLASFLVLTAACQSAPPPEPESRKAPTPSPAATPVVTQTATAAPTPPPVPSARKVVARPTVEVAPAADDPLKGKFTLDDALQGLTKTGSIYAKLETDKGTLDCELWQQKAPITVANFVGLARGLRPWKRGGEWVKKPLYDGTPFHRIIKGFMIQGGDPAGNGTGDPGYVIPDEIWEDAHHDKVGLLCMANRGPNTNGSQFFIMDGVAAHLDGGYTIFGKCEPESVVEALASSPVQGDRAVDPPKLRKVTIRTKK